MRIRLLHRPPARSIDGLHLQRFEPGSLYDVGATLGALMLAEGWAEPVTSETPALLVPLDQGGIVERLPHREPHNLVRERLPHYFDHLDIAGDLRRRSLFR
jgi:hypothetical protein